jgi:hypothetical protein
MRGLDLTQDIGLSANVDQRVDAGKLGRVLLRPANPGGLGASSKSSWLMLIATSGRGGRHLGWPEPVGYDLDH